MRIIIFLAGLSSATHALSSLICAEKCPQQEQLTDTGMLSLVDLPSPEKDTLWATQDCLPWRATKLICFPVFHVPIGSMYGMFTYIYHTFMINVGNYTSPMDPMGSISQKISFFILCPKKSMFFLCLFVRPTWRGYPGECQVSAGAGISGSFNFIQIYIKRCWWCFGALVLLDAVGLVDGFPVVYFLGIRASGCFCWIRWMDIGSAIWEGWMQASCFELVNKNPFEVIKKQATWSNDGRKTTCMVKSHERIDETHKNYWVSSSNGRIY